MSKPTLTREERHHRLSQTYLERGERTDAQFARDEANLLGVSASTIRRDLIWLRRAGLLPDASKSGASPAPESAPDTGMSRRRARRLARQHAAQ